MNPRAAWVVETLASACAPPKQGAAEIIGYLTLNEDDIDVTLDESEETLVGFLDADGSARRARLPRVTVSRR